MEVSVEVCGKICSKVCGVFGAESVWWSVGRFAGRPVEVCGKVCRGSPSEGLLEDM